MTRSCLTGAALLVTMALASATPSVAANNPIPGVDIIVEKKPPPPSALVIGSVGPDGGFSIQAKLAPGNYVVRTACTPRVRCHVHRLTSLTVNGRTVSTASSGGIRIAVGDVNGDGRAELTTFRGTITVKR